MKTIVRFILFFVKLIILKLSVVFIYLIKQGQKDIFMMNISDKNCFYSFSFIVFQISIDRQLWQNQGLIFHFFEEDSDTFFCEITLFAMGKSRQTFYSLSIYFRYLPDINLTLTGKIEINIDKNGVPKSSWNR